MGVMCKLPVVPICRRPSGLQKWPNQPHVPRVSRRPRGALRPIVTKRGRGMRWTTSVERAIFRADERYLADDEIAWSWRPWAGAKFAGDEPENDGDYEVTDTGESAKISVNTVARGRPGRSG